MTGENIKVMTCIECPVGCRLVLKLKGDKEIVSIDGNKCKRGAAYAGSEIIDPRRSISSSIILENSKFPLVSVKTKPSIAKNMIFSVMKEIRSAKVSAPVKMGDILIKNVAGTGSDIVATEDRID